MPPEVMQALKAATPDAVAFLQRLILNEDARDADRLRAAEIILDRTYGKPVQAVDLDAPAVPQVVFIGGDNIAD